QSDVDHHPTQTQENDPVPAATEIVAVVGVTQSRPGGTSMTPPIRIVEEPVFFTAKAVQDAGPAIVTAVVPTVPAVVSAPPGVT
ncbi:MAG: hypothetical protein EB117_14265, partial [Betaproteobacteria bacterium]|nr:hypothetical protein [Betaproteobacteria bacterium]